MNNLLKSLIKMITLIKSILYFKHTQTELSFSNQYIKVVNHYNDLIYNLIQLFNLDNPINKYLYNNDILLNDIFCKTFIDTTENSPKTNPKILENISKNIHKQDPKFIQNIDNMETKMFVSGNNNIDKVETKQYISGNKNIDKWKQNNTEMETKQYISGNKIIDKVETKQTTSGNKIIDKVETKMSISGNKNIVNKRIKELLNEGKTTNDIATILNDEGYKTIQGISFTRGNVKVIIQRHIT
jgi:hypothetical protein